MKQLAFYHGDLVELDSQDQKNTDGGLLLAAVIILGHVFWNDAIDGFNDGSGASCR